MRTQLLNAGYPLSEVTAALTRRWLADEPRLRLLPMTDDRVETHVTIADEQAPGGRRAVHFQEYWVRLHAEPPALDITLVGSESARPAPGVTEALAAADLVLVAPSNPVVSIGPILQVPGIRQALRAQPGTGGRVRRNPRRGAGARHGPPPAAGHRGGGRRGRGRRALRGADAAGVLDVWAMDTADAGSADRVREAGLRPVVTDLIMTDPEATAAFISYAVKSGTAEGAQRPPAPAASCVR